MPDFTYFHVATVTPDWRSDDPKAFPHPIHHRPIGACLMRLPQDGSAPLIHTDGMHELTDAHERALLQALIQRLPEDTYESLAGVSVRRFSAPVLFYRALRFGLPTAQLARAIVKNIVDVSVLLGREDNSPSLSALAQLVGFAKRQWLDVGKAWKDGQSQLIVDRLEVDVLLIACLHLRLQFCMGHLDREGYGKQALAALNAFKTRTEFSADFLKRSDIPRFLAV